jgi:hypothetical protein
MTAAATVDEVLTAAGRLGYDRRDLAALFEVLEHMTPAPSPR